MNVDHLSIFGALHFHTPVFPDVRGQFSAPFQHATFREAVGHEFTVSQTNLSPTRRGAIRGIHFSDVPPGQAKYVYAASGRLLDVVVDIRVGSPTFGTYTIVELVASDANAVYLAEGLGHLAIAITDNASLSYLCSTAYSPTREHGITPLDPHIGLPIAMWKEKLRLSELLISSKDADAPTLKEAASQGILPSFDECQKYYDKLKVNAGTSIKEHQSGHVDKGTPMRARQ